MIFATNQVTPQALGGAWKELRDKGKGSKKEMGQNRPVDKP
jgi:hypothetical protein